MSVFPSSPGVDADGADELQRLFLAAKAEEMAALAAQQKQHSSADTALAAKLSAHKLKKSQKLIDNAFHALQRMEEKTVESAMREEERMRQKLMKGKRRRSVVTGGGGGQHGPLLSLLKELPSLPAGVDVRCEDLYDALMLSAQHGVDVASEDGRQLVVTLLTQLTAERPNRPPHSARNNELPQIEAEMLQRAVRGATPVQRQWVELAYQHPMLASIITTEETTLLASNRSTSTTRPTTAAIDPAIAAEAFGRLRKLFVGAIKRLSEEAFVAHLDGMRELIDGGYFDLNDAMKENGETALHIACRHGKARIVEWLLQYGRVDVRHVTTPTRLPALHEALSAMATAAAGEREGYEAVLQLLMAAGADMHAVNADGVTASEMARKAGVDIGSPAAGDTMDGMLDALERVDGRLLDEESKQDALLRSKLQKGKANKTQRLMKAAIADADKLSTRQQTEEARQQQLLNDKLSRARNSKSTRRAQQQRQQSTVAVDEPQWCEEVLLGWLSEETKGAIVELHAMYGSVEGVDLQLLARLKGLDGSEAELVVGGERSFGDDELSRLQDTLGGGAMDDEERLQVTRIADVMRCNQCIYNDVLAVLGAKGSEKGTALTALNNGQPPPFPDVNTTFASALPSSFTPQLPPPLLAAICTDLSAHLALLLPSPPTASELSQGQVDWEALAAVGVDTELLVGVLCMSVDDVSLLCVGRLKSIDDEKRALHAEEQRRAVAAGGWTVEEAEEVEQLRAMWAANTRLYETMSGLIRQWREHGRLLDEPADAQQSRPWTASSESEVDADSGLSNSVKLQSTMLDQLQEMAAEHLGHTVEEMRGMTEENIRTELVKRGVDVDIMEEMKRLSEAEVGRYLAQQKAEKDAEAAMIRKMLGKKGLLEAKRKQLEEKERLLADAGRMYNNMMASLIAGEKRQGERMSAEEQAAHDRMLAKMEEKRRRKQQAAQDADTGLSTKSKVNSVLADQLREMAAEHLGKTAEEMAAMSESEVRQQLADKDFNMDILAEMQRLSEAEVGQMLAKQKAERDAEAAMIRKMMSKKGLSEAKRAQLEAREKQLMDASKLYEDMLSSIVSGERKQGERMTAEEQAAHTAMMAKMEERRRKKADKQRDDDTGLSTESMVKSVLVDQLQEMAAEHLGKTMEELQAMTEAEMKDECAKRGIDVDIWAEMKRLTEAELGQQLAQQKAQCDAEAAMIRKMLRGKGLTEAKRKELEERERQLASAGQLYEDMLSSLVAGERKQGEQRTKEEEAAHQAMMAKLEAKRRRKEEAARDADTGLSTDEKVKEYVVAQLQELAAEHLGLSMEQVRGMSEADMKEQLASSGVDVDIWAEMQRLSEAEVGKYLATQKAQSDAEAAMIRKMLKGKGLTAAKRKELEERARQLVAAAQLYEDMLSSVVAGERKQLQHMSEEEQMAHQRMILKMEQKRKKKQRAAVDEDTGLSKDNKVQAYLVEQLQEMAAEHLGRSVGELRAMSEDELKAQLAAQGVDMDIWAEMSKLSEAEVGKMLARQRAKKDAELAMIRKMLKGKGLTEAKRKELEERERQLVAAAQLYEDMLSSLVAGERTHTAHLSQQEATAHAAMMAKLEAKRRAKEAAERDEDTGLSLVDNVTADMLRKLQDMAAEHLGLSTDELKRMSDEEMKEQLLKKGVDIDILHHIQQLTEAEAGRYLAQQKARNEAEAAMIRKMLKGKGLTDAKRAELLEREKQLMEAGRLYDDMLLSLMSGEKRHGAHRGREEEAAHQRMLAKMEEKRRRKEQEGAQQNQDDGVAMTSSLLANLCSITADHLSLPASASFDALSSALTAAGAPFDLLAMLQGCTDAEAAQLLWQQRMKDEAELRMLRKMMAKGKGRMSEEELAKLAAREDELLAALDLYDDMLRAVLDAEKKRFGAMSREEQAAYERMRDKLAAGKRRKHKADDSAGADDSVVLPSQLVGDNALLMHVLAPLATSQLGLSAEQLASMRVDEVQAALRAAGVEVDLEGLLRNLMDSEAAQWMARQREEAEAEREMVRRLLAGKGRKLTADERKALEARERELDGIIDSYDEMFKRLLAEERKRRGLMDEAERRAYEDMMDKLRNGKKKKQTPQTDIDPTQKIGDQPQLLDMLSGLAAMHLSLSPEQVADLTVQQLQDALTKAGVDIDIMEMLRNLTDSEAAKWLAAQREKAAAEADMLRKLLAGKGRKLTAAEREEMEAKLSQLEDDIANYDDLLRRLLEEEMKKQKHMTEEERLAYERMMDKLRQGKKKKQLDEAEVGPQTLVGDSPQLMELISGLGASNLGLTRDQLATMTVEEVQAALNKAGVDIDIMEMLRNLADSEAAKWLAAQREKAAAEADMLRRLLKGKKLTDAERAAAEARLAELEAEIANYDDLLRRLLEEEMKKMKKMEEEERIAYEDMMNKLRRGKKRGVPDTDIDPTQKIGDQPQLLDMLSGLAAMHLSLSPEQVADLTVQQLQDALTKAGVDIDIMEMLRNLTDSEAAKWLAAQREKAAAEADMLRKLLAGKGRKLTDAERADAEARLQQLDKEIANYDDLLRRLLDEEMRKMKKMEEEERLAYERMMDKLRRGKNKKQQQQPIGDVTPQTLVGDNPQLMDLLAGLADAHLGLSRDQLASMTVEEVQAALNKAGVDIDIMEMLRNLTDSVAAKWLAAQREKAAAEADMLRRLLKGKKLTPKERQEAEARLAHLEKEIENYDELLRRLLQEELNKLKRMEEEERRAYEAMMDRLRRGKKKKAGGDVDGVAEVDHDVVVDLHSVRSDPRLRVAAEAVFDLLCMKGTYSCRRCLTVNTATASFCSLCLTPAPVQPSPILSVERLVSYHCTVHLCSGAACVECVRRVEVHLGAPCVRSNFFEYLELLCVMCHRWRECSWDELVMRGDERGVGVEVGKKVWMLNQFDGGKHGEKGWQRLVADEERQQGEWIGSDVLRSDCVQVPDILDYM